LHLNVLIIGKDITLSVDTHLRWMKEKMSMIQSYHDENIYTVAYLSWCAVSDQ